MAFWRLHQLTSESLHLVGDVHVLCRDTGPSDVSWVWDVTSALEVLAISRWVVPVTPRSAVLSTFN